ncbi:diol dehydratase reactivase ATPase-like domain-containing protein [Microbispora sp. NPDC046933]|uniref:diol dehydratase reactivase ATPase-like domain-containing protein n=1 Tax=Microbispora sp. NPDC046933 TaxID=3155618 RepID=UPI0033F50FA0
MSVLVAGVDVGNATTEVVIVRDGVPVAWDRVVTRGPKGSPSSLAGAAALLRRLERGLGEAAAEVVMAPMRPVRTTTVEVPVVAAGTGRLRIVAAGSPTPGGEGVAVGRPLLLTPGDLPHGEDVIALVPRDLGYAEAARLVRAALDAGIPLLGVLAEGDEGRLIANRIGRPLPVADQVDVTAVAAAKRVAVEVRPPGRPLRHLSDALFVAARLGERDDAPAICAELYDVSCAVVARFTHRQADSVGPNAPEASVERAVADLSRVAATAGARAGTSRSRSLLVAEMSASAPAAPPARLDLGTAAPTGHARTPADRLAGSGTVPVRRAPSEAAAARAGALTTPGADRNSLVVDLGGGTVDVVGPPGEVVAAGAGDLLTAAVATVLGIPRGAADWVKRGPCVRLETPHVSLGEDGSRVFLDSPAPPGSVGWLAVPGPAGPLPFSSAMSPAEWRTLRLAVKREVIGATVRRALDALNSLGGRGGGSVVVVGGPAGDDEVLGVLARELPPGTVVGRGNVAGVLGHRYAVAYGLATGAYPRE